MWIITLNCYFNPTSVNSTTVFPWQCVLSVKLYHQSYGSVISLIRAVHSVVLLLAYFDLLEQVPIRNNF